MCGIAGFWKPGGAPPLAAEQAARMALTLTHRGPDDAGTWVDGEAGIALGHRRLAILDLTPEGHQPMVSHDDRWVIAYNGEIYNFRALRAELGSAGVVFRGHSDTEVLVEAIARWGLLAAVRRLAGMFALAAWDRGERTLHLARDRFGEKPLYYGWQAGTFLFGSELKALRAFDGFQPSVDEGALGLLLRYGYIPGPACIYHGIHKLEPGTLARVRPDGPVDLVPYWSLATVVNQGRTDPLEGSDDALVTELERQLRLAIGEQMVADVPLGAFLSGGLDSSTVVALMQAQSPSPVRTFTIGFHESDYNEADHAARVAQHLGTAHTALYVTPAEARDVIPQLPALYDEPFADSSQIPTFLVSRLARQHVTVALTGDGGDELLGGYTRYFHGERIWRRVSPIPAALRRGAGQAIDRVAPDTWDRLFRAVPPGRRVVQPGTRIHKLGQILRSGSLREMYGLLVSLWEEPELVMAGGPRPVPSHRLEPVPGLGDVEQMMYWDAKTYLPDDIMVKVDRAGMAVSLETRAPFLDHRVVELAWRLPHRLKVRGGTGKWAMRQILARHVPPELTERPKQGFGVPIDSWLRGPLREWAGDLLSESRLRRQGFFVPSVVRRTWEEHQSGARNWQYRLWILLMFQAWLDAASAAVSQPVRAARGDLLMRPA